MNAPVNGRVRTTQQAPSGHPPPGAVGTSGAYFLAGTARGGQKPDVPWQILLPVCPLPDCPN